MSTKCLLLWTTLFLCLKCFSQDYGDFAKIEKDKLQRDLDLLYQALDQYHSGMYWYTSKDSVDMAYQDIKGKIDRDLNVLEFHKLIAPLVGLTREDHTDIYLPSSCHQIMKKEAHYLPFFMVFLGDELYIEKNGSLNDENVIGKRVISINGEIPQEIVNKIGSLFASDAYIKTVKKTDLSGFSFAKYYYYFYGNPDEFIIEFEDGSITCKGLTKNEIIKTIVEREKHSKTNKDHSESLEFELLNKSTAYMAMHSFANYQIRENEINSNLKKFLKESFESIETNEIENLIIDLSKNGGGNEGNEGLVYSYLASNYKKYIKVRCKTQKVTLDNGVDPTITFRTFGLGEKILANRKMADGSYERKNWPGLGLMAYKKEPQYKFEGNLYVLISPVTYSGGSELANMIRSNTEAVFIGQETGGGYLGNTSGYSQELVLAHSQISIDIPALQFIMNVNQKSPSGRGVIPDYEVIPTFEEYEIGRNVSLEKALRLINP